MDRDATVGSRRWTVLFVVVLALLVVEAWAPFRPELPVLARSAPAWLGRGTVAFDGSAALESGGAMAWVGEAARSSELRVALEARSAGAAQGGPARLFEVAADHYQANLVVGQSGPDLVVRLRRPGSDASGKPALRAPGLLADAGWHRIEVAVHDGVASLVADGVVVAREDVGPGALGGWDVAAHVALGDAVVGERGWRGDLRLARVEVAGGEAVDLLAGGVLEAASGVIVRERVHGVLALGNGDAWFLTVARVLAFVPLGALARRRWARFRSTASFVAAFSLVLLVGKVFVAGRHPVLADALFGLGGALLGAAWARRLQPRRPPPDGAGVAPVGGAPLPGPGLAAGQPR